MVAAALSLLGVRNACVRHPQPAKGLPTALTCTVAFPGRGQPVSASASATVSTQLCLHRPCALSVVVADPGSRRTAAVALARQDCHSCHSSSGINSTSSATLPLATTSTSTVALTRGLQTVARPALARTCWLRRRRGGGWCATPATPHAPVVSVRTATNRAMRRIGAADGQIVPGGYKFLHALLLRHEPIRRVVTACQSSFRTNL